MQLKIVLSLVLFCFSTATFAQPITVIEFKLDSILSYYHSDGLFNGSVNVEFNGNPVFNRSYGLASPAENDTLSSKHKFGIGSIYKEFPAVVVMKLSEENKININDNIGRYVQGLPDWAREVSILDLLQYTSGLPNIDWNKYFSQNLIIEEEYLLNDLKDINELNFVPGTGYLYSNFNPFLLIKAIEMIMDKKFASIVEDELLYPIGITGHRFQNAYPYENTNLMAVPMNSDLEQDNYKINYTSMLLTLTPHDLAVWVKNLHQFELINEESLMTLSQTADLKVENMQAPLGICTVVNGDIIEHTHHGGMGNYESLLIRDNKIDMSIILMTNIKNGNVFEIADEIKKVLHQSIK